MKYSIYVKNYKFHYSADSYKVTDVTWTNEPVMMIKNPTEAYEEDLYSDIETCGVSGDLYIPISQISHIIMFD